MSAGQGTCPVCGGPVRVAGDPVEGTMHYEPTTPEALRKAVRIIARLENRQRTREGQDFLIEARRALG